MISEELLGRMRAWLISLGPFVDDEIVGICMGDVRALLSLAGCFEGFYTRCATNAGKCDC